MLAPSDPGSIVYMAYRAQDVDAGTAGWARCARLALLPARRGALPRALACSCSIGLLPTPASPRPPCSTAAASSENTVVAVPPDNFLQAETIAWPSAKVQPAFDHMLSLSASA